MACGRNLLIQLALGLLAAGLVAFAAPAPAAAQDPISSFFDDLGRALQQPFRTDEPARARAFADPRGDLHRRTRPPARHIQRTGHVLRKPRVVGCRCEPREVSAPGPMGVDGDPTLRPGDIVATAHGLVVFTGRSVGGAANFTPVGSYGPFSPALRTQLSALRVAKPDRQPPNADLEVMPLKLRLSAER